jgi:conjugative transfer signal peptidase TraF
MTFRRRPFRALVALLAAWALVSCLAAVVASHLIWNRTPSMPLGLYWLTRTASCQRSDLVAFPVPASVRRLVHDRHYLPDGHMLVKPVVALPGDSVCTRDGFLAVNEQPIGAVLREDTAGRALPRYDVCGSVPPGQLYVASRNPRSFDSRTFGPVDLETVHGTVTPLWTY